MIRLVMWHTWIAPNVGPGVCCVIHSTWYTCTYVIVYCSVCRARVIYPDLEMLAVRDTSGLTIDASCLGAKSEGSTAVAMKFAECVPI